MDVPTDLTLYLRSCAKRVRELRLSKSVFGLSGHLLIAFGRKKYFFPCGHARNKTCKAMPQNGCFQELFELPFGCVLGIKLVIKSHV